MRHALTLGSLLCAAVLAWPSGPAQAEITWTTITDDTNDTTYSTRPPEGAGVRDGDKTWVAWNGRRMNIFVREYTHSTNSWGAALQVATVDWDPSDTPYHDYPMMTLAPDGRLIIFYADHTDTMYQVKAPNARSITGTWRHTTINPLVQPAYPKFQVVGSSIYLFANQEPQMKPYRPLLYTRSTNSGESDAWSPPAMIIDTRSLDLENFDEVYLLGTHADSQGRIHLVWHMAGGPGGHAAQSRHLYYAYLSTSDLRMRNAKGQNLGVTIDNAEIDDCMVVEQLPSPVSDPNNGRKHPIAQAVVLTNGNAPVIAYSVHDKFDNLRLMWARWNGSDWVLSTITNGTSLLYDVERRPGDGNFMVAFANEEPTHTFIKHTWDAGATWVDNTAAPIEYIAGANYALGGAFIENATDDTKVKFILQQLNTAVKDSDYNGTWPVLTAEIKDQTVISENFNQVPIGGAPPNWELTQSSGTTVGAESTTLLRSLRFTDNSATGSAKATRWFTNETDVVTLQWTIRQPTYAPVQKMIVRSGTTVAVELYAGNGGLNDIVYTDHNGNLVSLAGYLPSVWHTVKVTVNVVADTCDLWVDGTVRAAGVPLRNAVSGIDNVHFSTGTSQGSSSYTQYVDDFWIKR